MENFLMSDQTHKWSVVYDYWSVQDLFSSILGILIKRKKDDSKKHNQQSKTSFNVSIAEIEMQDSHQNGVIGFACVSQETQHADQIIQNVINYIENNIEAEIYDIEIEII